jgi:hypothetical protein
MILLPFLFVRKSLPTRSETSMEDGTKKMGRAYSFATKPFLVGCFLLHLAVIFLNLSLASARL